MDNPFLPAFVCLSACTHPLPAPTHYPHTFLLPSTPTIPTQFELMYEQVKALKEGKAVDKPIYNHVSGLLDPAEKIESPNVRTGECVCTLRVPPVCTWQ